MRAHVGTLFRSVTPLCATLLSLLAIFAAREAHAWDVEATDLELTVPLGYADRASTGTNSDLAGYRYDNSAGLLTGFEARLMFGGRHAEMFHMGLIASAQHQAGPLLGAVDGAAFRSTYMDFGINARVLFPCMSSERVQWRLSALLALTGMHADAQEGVFGVDNGPDTEARERAADELDHAALGWRLAADLSIHLDNFVVGLAVGVRQYTGIDTPVERTWVMDAGLRLGGRLDLLTEPEPNRSETGSDYYLE